MSLTDNLNLQRPVGKIARILPKILAIITGHDRYLPEIEWSSQSWVHNIFRFYELIFWRRFGIRAEMSSWIECDRNGNIYTGYAFHSIESVLAFAESWIRGLVPRILPQEIYVPALSAAGTPMPLLNSPYLFAIAFDTATSSNNGGSGTTLTLSHTCTGSNGLLWSFCCSLQGDSVSGVTQAGNAMSQAVKKTYTSSTETGYAYYKAGPTTGAQNVVVTNSVNNREMYLNNQSYSGCKQTGIPDNTATQETNTTSMNQSLTTVADNCWVACGVYGQRNKTASTGVTHRSGTGTQGFAGDSNGPKTPAGSYSMIVTISAGLREVMVMVSFAPQTTTTNTATSTAKARIKVSGNDKTIQAKGRVKVLGNDKTIQGKARIKQLAVTKTIQAKSRIKVLDNDKTIQAKAQISKTGVTVTTSAKSRIKQIDNQATISAGARVIFRHEKEIQAKARIFKTVPATIDAKARIFNPQSTTTISAKGRIKQGAITKTISALSRIKKTVTNTIQAKARVASPRLGVTHGRRSGSGVSYAKRADKSTGRRSRTGTIYGKKLEKEG